MKSVTIHHGDSRDVLKGFADNSIDSVVTDPPYALVSIVKRFGGKNAAAAKSEGASGVYKRASAGFMGKTWDTGETAFDPGFWAEVLRVLKPGGYLIAASGTRTYHQLAWAIEQAGFDAGVGAEIRDMITNWLASDTFAGRFLDSLSEEQMRALLLAFDEHEFAGIFGWLYGSGFPKSTDFAAVSGSKKDGGRMVRPEFIGTQFAEGWGTALKPACEPWVIAQKPFDSTIAANVVQFGTGALNIDGCRIGTEGGTARSHQADYAKTADGKEDRSEHWARTGHEVIELGKGRWPANVIHDGSDEVVGAFPDAPGQQGDLKPTGRARPTKTCLGDMAPPLAHAARGDSGSAARFFYSAKADADDRMGSKHPTVKPIDLMRYLVRLITPPGGVVLDPFAGSGSTGVAAMLEGFDSILIEREAEYVADIERKIAFYRGEGRLAAQEKSKFKQDSHDDLPLFGGEAA